MVKKLIAPVLAIVLCAAVLLVGYNGLGALRAKREAAELNDRMTVLLPGSTSFAEEAYTGEDDNIRAAYKGETGYVVLTQTRGYADDIVMLIGVTSDGKVTGLQVRRMNETWGLGREAMTNWEFLRQFLNTEGDAQIGENVDALTGATVTSKAIARCVNSAVAFVTGSDADSGATSWGG